MFPETPKTLLRKIAELAEGDDAAEWEAFVELYASPLENFIRSVNRSLSQEDVEDAVQDVFVRLVGVLRKGLVDRKKAKFRAYLASVARRLLIDRYRESLVRPKLSSDDGLGAEEPSHAVTDDPGTAFDVQWRLSVRAAAIEHVLTKTAVSEQSKSIYRALQGGALGEVAELHGVSYAAAKQVKSRLDRAVAAVERRLLK